MIGILGCAEFEVHRDAFDELDPLRQREFEQFRSVLFISNVVLKLIVEWPTTDVFTTPALEDRQTVGVLEP